MLTLRELKREKMKKDERIRKTEGDLRTVKEKRRMGG